jgi:hypothetical protein
MDIEAAAHIIDTVAFDQIGLLIGLGPIMTNVIDEVN